MRGQPSSRSTAIAAIMCAALLVAGCEAQGSGTPPDSDAPQAAIVEPQNNTLPMPQAPPKAPSAGFDGLDARTRQAVADAANAGADMSVVVLDRNTGQTVSVGSGSSFPIASVVKLFIADELLLRDSKGETTLSPTDRKTLDVMLRSSDDGAAQTFWDRLGGNAVIARVKARYGLGGTAAPWNGHWDVTTSTASDLVRYYKMLLDGSGGLPAEQAAVIMGNLAQSTPTGIDGYPQRFGIPEGLYAQPVAVKQGWFCCWNGGNQLHVSTGAIGPDRRYVMAMGSLDPTGAAAARDRMTQAVKTMFPGGKI
ncbi:serine hydrolase [Mycobacterium sp. ITM-2016-00318]|uniref:serine hydrolase n=1 Tax=Mycobacterium sp. ITM-2016-00318 TaxID=2099693 RepID=UPI000CFA4218|nr:serine hydrolase [Mycobacterium sp. ITM-2016-00318]WNG94717.1 serine hydrolase [Mycobacterium sp. ITM-2016-00318]